MIKYTGDLRCDFEKATAEITKLKDRIVGYQEQIASLRASVKSLKQSNDFHKKNYQESLAEKDAIIKELQNRLAHAEALLNHDGSNTGTPTSQTPINKNKVIPNSRRSSGRKKGGQPGHPKAALEAPEESEITDTVGHPLQDDECCPKCGLTDCVPTGESEVKFEYDVRIKVVKIKHEFFYYECSNCGTVFRSQIPPNLKEKVQYGSGLQAFALSLTNTVNAAMNKASMFLAGITGGELMPCEGYIAKLQARAANGLRQFRQDLKLVLITRKIVYWDDTVIFMLAQANPHITQFWWDVDAAAIKAVREKQKTKVGKIIFEYKSGILFITLPSGRKLSYVKPRMAVNKFGRDGLTYEGISENKKWSRIETYGPKLVENIVQGTARDLLAEAMLRVEEKGYPIVMHCHDEIIAEMPEGTGSVDEMCEVMAVQPEWAEGLPLRADGYQCSFYQKM